MVEHPFVNTKHTRVSFALYTPQDTCSRVVAAAVVLHVQALGWAAQRELDLEDEWHHIHQSLTEADVNVAGVVNQVRSRFHEVIQSSFLLLSASLFHLLGFVHSVGYTILLRSLRFGTDPLLPFLVIGYRVSSTDLYSSLLFRTFPKDLSGNLMFQHLLLAFELGLVVLGPRLSPAPPSRFSPSLFQEWPLRCNATHQAARAGARTTLKVVSWERFRGQARQLMMHKSRGFMAS